MTELLGLLAEEIQGGEEASGGTGVERGSTSSQWAWRTRKASLLVRERMAVMMLAGDATDSLILPFRSGMKLT